MDIKEYIETTYANPPAQKPDDFDKRHKEFIELIESGRIRAAEKGSGGWHVNHWVKQGILLGFKYGQNKPVEGSGDVFHFFDKENYPTQPTAGHNKNIRIVPGGSAVRTGAYVGANVTMMPPMYVNTGAYIDDGAMIDSHALVGSCAQVGQGVHLSAGAQLGGVLEPIGAQPVIIEDNCMIGGLAGIFEGTLVGEGAVIGAGVILTKSTPVYDLVHETVYRGKDDSPLQIPANAVVIPGSRPIKGHKFAEEQGISIQTPVIIKYRDEQTDQATELEELLR